MAPLMQLVCLTLLKPKHFVQHLNSQNNISNNLFTLKFPSHMPINNIHSSPFIHLHNSKNMSTLKISKCSRNMLKHWHHLKVPQKIIDSEIFCSTFKPSIDNEHHFYIYLILYIKNANSTLNLVFFRYKKISFFNLKCFK